MIDYPNRLKSGDIIGVTATSSGANIDRIDDAINNFNRLGFSTIETDNVRRNIGIVSSDGKTRAKEFMDLWNDKRVRCIVAARGGEFLMEMLPYLDSYNRDLQRGGLKWVQGFSDTSLLLYYLTTNYNIATAHAENIGDFAMKDLDISLNNTVNALKATEEFVQESFTMYQNGYIEQEEFNSYVLDSEVQYKSLYNREEEFIKGRLIGGCIDVLRTIVGTKYDNTVKFCKQFKEGMIFYIDNCELNLYEFYRVIWQLKEAHWFDNVKGFLVGRTIIQKTLIEDGKEVNYVDILKRAFNDFNVPVIYDVDIGHLAPQWTIINGAYGEFTYKDGKGKLIQKYK